MDNFERRAHRSLGRLCAYHPSPRLPRIPLAALDLVRYWIAITLAIQVSSWVPSETLARNIEEAFPLPPLAISIVVGVVSFLFLCFVLRALFNRFFFLSIAASYIERAGLVFAPDDNRMRWLNSDLERKTPEVEVVERELARIMRADPSTRLSAVAVSLAHEALFAAFALRTHRKAQARLEEERKLAEEKDASSPLGQLAQKARRAQGLDQLVADRKDPGDSPPRL